VDHDEVAELALQALRPFERDGAENPYRVQQDLQECMHMLVGIIRTEDELTKALAELEVLKERAKRVRVTGHRQYNPGWHLALDLDPLLAVSESIARAALARKESRGAQTRDDYPATDPELGKVNIVISQRAGELALAREPLPLVPDDLRALLEDS
jgi:succinate dehydrogenase / fumarate reductase flavoprotein subunit